MLIPFADNFPLKDCSNGKVLSSAANSLSGDTNETDVVHQKMIEEGKNLCIFGSDNIDWIKSFSAKIKEIKNTELQLEIRFFWLRLESMKYSITRQENASISNGILKEITGMLEVDNNEDGWVLIRTGSLPGLVKLQGKKVTECVELFPVWDENVGTQGLVGGIKSALEPWTLQ
ncbi:hypothetical protein ACH5RR_030770 [Cinchona calisaya]|uniref:Sieve element occlusion C-terminal domain-containing protein n=1 Tax=Cinchona calisaya TaxID=153742 RepID=A0ABD2YWV7_9GENT